MCTYTVARFSCRHEIWGRRIKLCTIGEDFGRNEIESDCTFRGTHPMKTMMNSQPCYKCMQTKALPSLCREKLQEARSAFKERWPEVAAANKSDAPVANHTAESGAMDNEKEKNDPVEQVVIEATVSPAATPPKVIGKALKPAGIPKLNAVVSTPKRTLPAPAKKTPALALAKATSPAPKTPPSRLSRLAMPTRKTSEKTTTPPANGSKITPPKAISKLPKPGFLRK